MQITPFNNSDEAVKIYTPPPRNNKAQMQSVFPEDSDNVRIYSIRPPQDNSSSDNSSRK